MRDPDHPSPNQPLPDQPSPDGTRFSRFKRIFGLLVAAALAPVGQAALAGGPDELAAMQAAPVSTPEAAPALLTAPPLLTGPQVYNAVCIACHAAPGVGGAPALGDGDAWAPRIAQGADTLIDHALYGFSGDKGVMPRKGGRLDLSDEEIVGAVEYMVEQAAE